MINEIINKINDKDDKLLLQKAIDKYNQFKKSGKSTSTVFLNEYQVKFLANYLKHLNIQYNIFILNEYCTKAIIYFGEYDSFITSFKIDGSFTHQEVLGTLFSIYNDPTMIGDIIIDLNAVYITNLTKYNNILLQEFTSISRNKVELNKVDSFIVNKPLLLEETIIVPSLRLDSVVAKLCNLSRSSATELINKKYVLANYKEIQYKYLLKLDDILSIRGYGKYKIGSIINNTKKDNLILKIYKYN